MEDALPNRIRELRTAQQLSQEALANRVGTLSKMQVSNIERGITQLTHFWMRRFATALQCYPSDLLPDEDVRIREIEERLLAEIIKELFQWKSDRRKELTERGIIISPHELGMLAAHTYTGATRDTESARMIQADIDKILSFRMKAAS
ncbi:MAG: helix-turn-helix transcriptional regulator [Planctomycetota bacterium]